MFRSCMIACAQLAGASVRHQIFITPLWFGLGTRLSLSLPLSFFFRLTVSFETEFALDVLFSSRPSRVRRVRFEREDETGVQDGVLHVSFVPSLLSPLSSPSKIQTNPRPLRIESILSSLPIHLHNPLRMVRRSPLRQNGCVPTSPPPSAVSPSFFFPPSFHR